MKETILAQRYAKALFSLALERELLDKVRSELHSFVAILEEQPDFEYFLRSPENSRASKREAVERLLQDRFSNLFLNFLLLVIFKGRYHLIKDVMRSYDDLYNRHHRRARALAITAVPLDQVAANDLRAKLSQSLKLEIELENQVAPGIIGGLVLNINGKVLDGSVKRQLEQLRARFLESRN